ncbi:pyridoxine [Patellaria atrata CBS 101060]|uniref:glutaminase n=1 Tax=Patellaria atrata CBS 101060 TaxID=1346257 RepID=A0A9P4VRI6_9PEZI|nr:pyridoxine [Patellaria atrata CBS 101060]
MITVGVLALQGAFSEHIQLLRQAAMTIKPATPESPNFQFVEVRTQDELSKCDALIIPGGESTAISLVAARSGLLEPLRDFVKVERKPTWGTCAGLILLAESANRTKKGGQELIGGLDVRVERNHFGRQLDSFATDLKLPFLDPDVDAKPFKSVFIRAPVVEKILPHKEGIQTEEAEQVDTVVAPSKTPKDDAAKRMLGGEVEILATLPAGSASQSAAAKGGDVIAIRQGNVFGTSFHPELTGDPRIHTWWLERVSEQVKMKSTTA